MIDKKTKKKNLYTALILIVLVIGFFIYTIFKLSLIS